MTSFLLHGCAGAFANFCLTASGASALELHAPVRCTLGDDCYVQQLPDHLPGPESTDFACGSLTYDGHSGTDFALTSAARIHDGVDVLAAADGVIAGLRNDMTDHFDRTGTSLGTVVGRECGNGVAITHADGWVTQYCHMKRGSIRHRVGDTVRQGDVIGQVGFSGNTSFAHLHLSVRQVDRRIDPFTGRDQVHGCGEFEASPIWAPTSGVIYRPGGLASYGLLDHMPGYDEILDTAPTLADLPANAEALVVWGLFFGLREADSLSLTIVAPDGREVAFNTHVMPKNRARQFRSIGVAIPPGGWKAGSYTGIVRLVRDGRVMDESTTHIACCSP